MLRLKNRYVPRELPVGPRQSAGLVWGVSQYCVIETGCHALLRSCQKACGSVRPLANRCLEEDGAGTVCSGGSSFWWKGVEPEHAEGYKFDNDASQDAGAQHDQPYSLNSFLNNCDDTFYVTHVFVVA